jgi:hypothetical protein
MRLLIAASSLLLLAAPGTASQKRDKVPPATPIGKPVDCLSLTQVRETRVRDDRTIDFYVSGRKVYRNTLDYSCPNLGFEQRFLYSTTISQICSVDTITVLESPGLSRGATCGLGQFQQVTLDKTAH